MIYVIKKPKHPLMWKHDCVFCGTEWLYDQIEVKRGSIDSIECPTCHATFAAENDITASDEEIERVIFSTDACKEEYKNNA